ncbi:MAG: serine/threonine protein kinase [Planctomycetes bacterium]|nr:serine/threonine protein kinase [Planctomycetota bacterium]
MSHDKKVDYSFGAVAVQLGYTTVERINECLRIQHKIKELGIEPMKLGEVMIDKGYLTEAQVKHIFRIQGLKGGHTTIAGYKIISEIGRGSMGSVYKALQISMDRVVAIKILAPQLAQNEKFVQRFFQEARAVAKLNHPNIVQGIDVGESNGVHYFAMEYIDGPSLEDVIKQHGPLSEEAALDIMIQTSKALEHAHKNNMVHRDVKPTNIMVTTDNVIKLCDLGLALIISKETAEQKRVIMGTPSYISPEQAKGDPDVDIRSDIYSLGATFYYILIGQPPFSGSTSSEVIKKHITEPLVAPNTKNDEISQWTNDIIIKMMTKKREDRHQTPFELIKELENTLQMLRTPLLEPEPLPAGKTKRLSAFSKLNRLRRTGVQPSFNFRYKKRIR